MVLALRPETNCSVVPQVEIGVCMTILSYNHLPPNAVLMQSARLLTDLATGISSCLSKRVFYVDLDITILNKTEGELSWCSEAFSPACIELSAFCYKSRNLLQVKKIN